MRISRREMLAAVGTMGAGVGVAAAAPAFPAFVQSRPLRIGALVSRMDRQGQDELIQPYDRQMRLGLELAIAEINAAGGILGRQVELLVADDEGSPAPGAAAAIDLIRNQGVEALVSGFVMAMPPYMDRTLEREGLDVPVVHAMQTPGTYCGRVAHVGSTTLQAITTLVEHRGPEARQRTFQISDWAPSQRTVSNQFYRHVQAGSTGAALVTTPVRGNSPGEYAGLVRWARDLDARSRSRRGRPVGARVRGGGRRSWSDRRRSPVRRARAGAIGLPARHPDPGRRRSLCVERGRARGGFRSGHRRNRLAAAAAAFHPGGGRGPRRSRRGVLGGRRGPPHLLVPQPVPVRARRRDG